LNKSGGLWQRLCVASRAGLKTRGCAQEIHAALGIRSLPISASSSASETTEAYFRCRSNRLAQCANQERSKQQSSTTNVAKPWEKASTAVARTQPEVE